MKKLLQEVRACTVCAKHLPHDPRPVLRAKVSARLLVVGQAPGRKVHESGVPWDDASGRRLREWLEMEPEVFYDEGKVSIIPMGFCFPGTGKSGDLPPRPECAPLWHPRLLKSLKHIQLTLLIGQYAQRYYLGDSIQKNLTETVRNYSEYLPKFLPLPHPSPRNQFWLRKNPWFEQKVIPELRARVRKCLSGT